MDLRELFMRLPEREREEFAARAGTTVGYVKAHLIARRKVPGRELMDGLVKACQHVDPAIARIEVVNYFYPETVANV